MGTDDQFLFLCYSILICGMKLFLDGIQVLWSESQKISFYFIRSPHSLNAQLVWCSEIRGQILNANFIRVLY